MSRNNYKSIIYEQEENIFLNFSDLEPDEKKFFINNINNKLLNYRYLILSYKNCDNYLKIYINLLNLEAKTDQKKAQNLINLNYLYIILSK